MDYSAGELTPDQVQALQIFARLYGRQWKSKLRALWERGQVTEAMGGILYRLRNTHGPSWLVGYKLPR